MRSKARQRKKQRDKRQKRKRKYRQKEAQKQQMLWWLTPTLFRLDLSRRWTGRMKLRNSGLVFNQRFRTSSPSASDT